MPEMTDYQPGTFCWVDLATTDTHAARDFYTGLFGWSAVDVPTDQGPPYTMLRKGDREVCALYPLPPEMGERPGWNVYVSVADVAAVTDAAASLGAQVLMAPMDVMTSGRMAVIQDPTGAALSLWQAGEHAGAALQNEPGAFCWAELQTNATDAAGGFYRELFGWTSRTSQSLPDIPYELFLQGDREVAGMLKIQEDWGPVPPNWAAYFCVADCDAAMAEAVRLGGVALFPAMEAENVGRFAFLQDPQGAAFAIIELAHPV